jgi:hypothetical protein
MVMMMNDEIYEMIQAICPRFAAIPETEKDVIARHLSGNSPAMIAQATGRGVESVQAAVDRYASLVSRVPDDVRLKLTRVMLTGSYNTFAAVASDRDKILKMTPLDAVKTMREMKKVIEEVMELETKTLEHNNKIKALNYDGFAKSLGSGE